MTRYLSYVGGGSKGSVMLVVFLVDMQSVGTFSLSFLAVSLNFFKLNLNTALNLIYLHKLKLRYVYLVASKA